MVPLEVDAHNAVREQKAGITTRDKALPHIHVISTVLNDACLALGEAKVNFID